MKLMNEQLEGWLIVNARNHFENWLENTDENEIDNAAYIDACKTALAALDFVEEIQKNETDK